MIESVLYILLFYLFCSVASAVGWILLFPVMKSFQDRGFAISKIFFFLTLSYFVWITASILPVEFSFHLILSVFFIITAISISLLKIRGGQLIIFIKENRKTLFIQEAVFLAAFIFFLAVRFGNPDLWHPYMGGEKPMDFAFINAIVNSSTLPPNDPWFSGYKINYYYFGQFIVATLIKLLSIPSSYFYNIFLSFLFAQTFLLAFSLINSLTKSLKAGLFGPFILFTGNLFQPFLIYENILNKVPINAWYWSATRIMPNGEINEFPYFSFLYADLHSHIISLPILIMFIFFVYQLVNVNRLKDLVTMSILIGFAAGVIRITNVWDYPTTFVILGAALVVRLITEPKVRLIKKLAVNPSILALIFIISNIAILPFLMNFRTGDLGISIYSNAGTSLVDYLVINGFFIIIYLVYFYFRSDFLIRKIKKIKRLLLLFPLSLSILFAVNNLLFLSFLSAFIAFPTYLLIGEKLTKKEFFANLLLVVAIFLTAIPDILEFKLGLGRMNTVFKFYFQAWILFALSSAYFAFETIKRLRSRRILLMSVLTVFGILFIASFSYIPTSTYAKINDRMSSNTSLTINGEAYMINSVYYDENKAIPLNPDYKAINWIRNNINKESVILEAVTPIYRWGSRISIYTGNPTVLGWDWHEIAHRQYLSPDVIHKRAGDVRIIYESEDVERTKSLLDLYQVSYIYLGLTEKVYYDTHGIQTLIDAGSVFSPVYSNEGVKIFKYNL